MSKRNLTFQRRGVVEGFFGPMWSMAQRKALFEFGAARGMNTYLYAPKDDPYHRKRWRVPYPQKEWQEMRQLVRAAQRRRIDFVYGFHPGEGLCFSDGEAVRVLLGKARRFYDAGVRTFAVLFDDIPSRLVYARDRSHYKNSLARAEGEWLAKINALQPASWQNVEWWICPSYYTPDPLLARVYGAFEPDFLDILAENLPASVACFWTGPAVVPDRISVGHLRVIRARLRHRLILWDNYPVNDLSMSDELHIAPLTGRDPRLPSAAYGYLNNPLLQADLCLIPLATCFDYASAPGRYDPERSWRQIIVERFGVGALGHWRAIRNYCETSQKAKNTKRPARFAPTDKNSLKAAVAYVNAHRREKWAREFAPWRAQMIERLG